MNNDRQTKQLPIPHGGEANYADFNHYIDFSGSKEYHNNLAIMSKLLDEVLQEKQIITG